jgi:hypothetical protein
MEALNLQAPLNLVLYIFAAFTAVYTSSVEPVHFSHTPIIPRILAARHSLQARKNLFHLYRLFRPLVITTPQKEFLYDTFYCYTVNQIHNRFGTDPAASPFIYPH